MTVTDGKIGSTRNFNAVASTTVVALNASTAVKIADARDDRIYLYISNESAFTIYIKTQASTVDNLKVGIRILKNDAYEFPVGNMYTGEVSAISMTDNPDVTVVEW